MFTVIIDVSDLRAKAGQWASFDKVFRADIDNAMRQQIGPMIVQDLQKRTPRSDKPKERHAADLWGSNYLGSFSAREGTLEFYNDADYLHFVVSGVSAHTITGDPLAFYWPEVGAMIYTRSVEHPGFGPNKFIEEMAQDRMPVAGGLIAASVALSIRKTIR